MLNSENAARLRWYLLTQTQRKIITCIVYNAHVNQPLFLVENVETRLSVDVRSSSTSHFKPLETLCFFKYKSMFTLSGEKLKL